MNPAVAGLLAAALLACSTAVAATCANHARARSGAEILDDSAITLRVKLALQEQPEVGARDIEVRTCHRDVQLKGFVDSQAQADLAGKVTAAVEGVRQVTNDLLHKPMQTARSRPACAPAGPCRP